MPTMTELISQVADETGLNATTDAAPILRAFNRAYRRIVTEADSLKATPVVLAGTAAGVDFAVSLATIDSVSLTSGGAHSSLPQVSVSEILHARPKSAATMYAFDGTTVMVDGPVGVGNSLYVRGTSRPTALTAAGTEASIAGIDPMFHEDLLAGFALVYLLEGYEGDEQRAAYYRQLALDALRRYKQFLVDRGGDEIPNSRYGASHFHTPNPLEL